MCGVLRGSRQRSTSLHPTGLGCWDQGLQEEKHVWMGLSPASQNAGTPKAPRIELLELAEQTAPAKGWDVGWPIAPCESTTQTPLCNRNNLRSYFVPGLSRMANAVSPKPLMGLQVM